MVVNIEVLPYTYLPATINAMSSSVVAVIEFQLNQLKFNGFLHPNEAPEKIF